MNETQLLSIQDFAESAGISRQAVYQQLDTRMKPYIQLVKGKKMIQAQALLDLYSTSDVNSVNENVNQVCQPMSSKTSMSSKYVKDIRAASEELLREKDAEIAALGEQLQYLREQISTKDAQIAVKDEQLASKDKQIEQLTSAISAAQETQKALAVAMQAAEALHAGTMQQQRLPETEQPEKLSLWKRIFRK